MTSEERFFQKKNIQANQPRAIDHGASPPTNRDHLLRRMGKTDSYTLLYTSAAVYFVAHIMQPSSKPTGLISTEDSIAGRVGLYPYLLTSDHWFRLLKLPFIFIGVTSK